MESACFSEFTRAQTYIRAAQNYIKADDDVNAEKFIRRASDLVFKVKDVTLTLQVRGGLCLTACVCLVGL